MDKITADALDESIRHWEQLATEERPEDCHIGAEHCALCRLYNNKINYDDDDEACKGCPVYEHTGEIWCNGTPFESISQSLKNWKRSPSNDWHWRLDAFAELEFLKSLRDNSNQS